jgi:3-hydroxybutyryl-CoA dehydrogenase
MRDAAHALLARDGKPVSVIRDSGGFVTQRVVATIVNIAADICQRRICTPRDLETAVTLGLGYPLGPLAMGDRWAHQCWKCCSTCRPCTATALPPQPLAAPPRCLGLSLQHVEE